APLIDPVPVGEIEVKVSATWGGDAAPRDQADETANLADTQPASAAPVADPVWPLWANDGMTVGEFLDRASQDAEGTALPTEATTLEAPPNPRQPAPVARSAVLRTKPTTSTKPSRLTQPLKWHGGKGRLASKIVAMMPAHVHFVEPYAGGLAV